MKRLVTTTCLLVTLAVLAPALADAADPFATCESAFARAPDTYDSALCFFKVAASQDRWEEGRQRLSSLRQRHPTYHWLTLCLAYISTSKKRSDTEELFGAAADGFRQQGKKKGEVLARINLARHLLFSEARIKDANTQLKTAQQVASEAGDPELRVRTIIARSEHAKQSGSGYESAYRALIEATKIKGVPARLRRFALDSLGGLAHELGRYDAAIDHYRELESLTQNVPVRGEHAAAAFNLANSMLEKHAAVPSSEGRQAVIDAAEAAVTASVEADNKVSQAAAHSLLANLYLREDATRARTHVEQCAKAAQASRQPHWRMECLWARAKLVVDAEPAAAADHIDEALEIAVGSPDRLFVAHAWRARTDFAFRTGHRQQGVRDGLRLLDVVENFRRLQVADRGRASLLSRWADDYYLLAGRILHPPSGVPTRADFETAFAIMERLRARVLLDRRLDFESGLRASAAKSNDDAQRTAQTEIAKIHRRLLQRNRSDRQRQSDLQALEGLERKEAALRDAAYAERGTPRPAPTFVSLSEAQSLLRPNEALLSFQIGLQHDLFGGFGGGAWLTVVTTDNVELYSVPDRVQLETSVPVFAGMFADRSEETREPAVALYDQLLRSAVEQLPSNVDRLIVIPDGRLYQLPFAALRATPDAKPIASRYQLSFPPSATLWASWRRALVTPAPRPAWVFADPAFAYASLGGGADERLVDLLNGPDLRSLPYARAEGAAIESIVGADLAVGEAASEHALKTGEVSKYAVLHMATHAVIDERHPGRSAVLLAPGTASEDGLLQPREIIELELGDRIVVLSGCRTAAGRLVRGEGVMGLAHSFFESGARSVVASLWPLSDRDAERFFGAFYQHLADGVSIDQAVRRTQAQQAEQGVPEPAWAGIVALGDGSTIPFPGGRTSLGVHRTVVVTLIALGLFVIGVRLFRRN